MASTLEDEIQKKDAEILRLQEMIHNLNNELEAAQHSSRGLARHRQMNPHAQIIQQIDHHGNGKRLERPIIRPTRERMGRKASITTQQVMASLPSTDSDYAYHPLAVRILDMFQSPSLHIDYLNSEQFAKDLFKLCQKVRYVLEREPRVVFLQSPAYIFGDIHGNLEDLHFFSDNIWRLGMSLTAGNFVFLGDYVDRGMSCLEVTAYLLAMKLQLPHKVFLLRGNHETRDVNGWEEHYGERSFIYQCRSRFGDDIGYRVWEACNQVFDRLPLAGVVDQDIFCVHGGIPRPVTQTTTRVQDILNVPKVAGINPPYEHEDDTFQRVASDCIWSDPASEQQEQHSVDPETGFGESLRGGGAICFGNKAVTDFLQQQGFSYIMRAHEAHAEGVAVSKGARVFTVFSTSKDHNQGSQALAGCILVDGEKLQVINRSPAYKNQYVHRRDSVSLASLSSSEIVKRMRLGLVTAPNQDSSDEDEQWDEFDSSDDEHGGQLEEEPLPQYTFSTHRRSSIDLTKIAETFHDPSTYDSLSNSEREAMILRGPLMQAAAAAAGNGTTASMDLSGLVAGAGIFGSSREMSGLVNDVISEQADDDDDASTVDGEAEMNGR